MFLKCPRVALWLAYVLRIKQVLASIFLPFNLIKGLGDNMEIIKMLSNMRISKSVSKYDDEIYHVIIEQWTHDSQPNKKVKFEFLDEKGADIFIDAMDRADGIVLS
jgi:hypothetical protein